MEEERYTDQPKRVVESSTKDPLPQQGTRRMATPDKVKVDATEDAEYSKQTVFFLIYMLYETHFFTRQHLQHLFAVINKKEKPKDIVKYLVEEAAK